MGPARRHNEGHAASSALLADHVALVPGLRPCPPPLACPLDGRAGSRQVGVIRAAHKGRKSWNPREAQKELRAASLGIRAHLTLGGIGRRSLQDIAGVEVSTVFGSRFDKSTATN